MAWIAIWFSISNTRGNVWLNGVGENRETDKEHDEDCVEERFLLARAKFGRDGEGDREALGVGNRSINIWDGSELELAWSKKSSSYFENNFPIILSSGISNASMFKVVDALHWVTFLLMKTFSNIFRRTFCWAGNIWIYFISHLFSIIENKFYIIKSFFITITITWCFCWYWWWWGFFLVFF